MITAITATLILATFAMLVGRASFLYGKRQTSARWREAQRDLQTGHAIYASLVRNAVCRNCVPRLRTIHVRDTKDPQ